MSPSAKVIYLRSYGDRDRDRDDHDVVRVVLDATVELLRDESYDELGDVPGHGGRISPRCDDVVARRFLTANSQVRGLLAGRFTPSLRSLDLAVTNSCT